MGSRNMIYYWRKILIRRGSDCSRISKMGMTFLEWETRHSSTFPVSTDPTEYGLRPRRQPAPQKLQQQQPPARLAVATRIVLTDQSIRHAGFWKLPSSPTVIWFLAHQHKTRVNRSSCTWKLKRSRCPIWELENRRGPFSLLFTKRRIFCFFLRFCRISFFP